MNFPIQALFGFVRMASASQTGLATGSEGLICFVCDIGVVGRYYALATCRTQTTKVRLIEKLGQLVGEEYMVVISEDDIICRGCATMINSLDRLEKELGSLRSMVLRYLEKKYEMEEGELVNTRSNPPLPLKDQVRPRESNPNDFQARKRKAMMGGGDNIPDDVRNAGKDTSWLQCDKCKYTTNYSSFMAHHARVHNKKKEASQTQGSLNQSVNQNQANQQTQQTTQLGQQILVQNQQNQPVHDVSKHISLAQIKQNGDDKSAIVQIHRISENDSETITPDIVEGQSKEIVDGPETVEMIAAEIGQDFGDGTEKGQMLAMVEVEKQMTLQAVEGEDGNNTLCMVDENGIIVQKVEQAEDGTLYVQMPEGADSTKQVLSVADDGSVQMVEVLWDDMVSPDETEGHSMVTF